MAPRRLIALMIGLLLFSSVITALIPTDKRDSLDTTAPKTGKAMPKPRLPEGGKLLSETIRANSAKRPVLSARVGDQLSLRVTGKKPATVELVGLGATSDLDPSTPATFNVLLLQTGRYEIEDLASGRRLGQIRVGPELEAGEDRPTQKSSSGEKQDHGPPPDAPEQA